MNIFVFNLDPFLAAKDHPKSYLVKMPLETAQLLCTAHHVLNPNKYNIPYKKTHENHPCAVWVRQTKENYLWTINYGLGLCRWFTETRKKTHGCESIIYWFWEPNGCSGKTSFCKYLYLKYGAIH